MSESRIIESENTNFYGISSAEGKWNHKSEAEAASKKKFSKSLGIIKEWLGLFVTIGEQEK